MFIFKREGFFLSRVREAGGILYGDSSVMYLCKFLHSMSVGYKRFQHAFHPINIYHMELERNCKREKKSKKKKMKRWGLCWKSRREWTLLVCHARVGRFPVITVYALREMNRPQPDGSRHQGAAQFHTVFSHTWSGIIQNKLDWALWCQLGNQIIDVLLKIIMADVVLFEHHPPVLQTRRICSSDSSWSTYFQIRCERLQKY